MSEQQGQGLSIKLLQQDLVRFHKGETQFKAAIKLFQEQGGNLKDKDDV